MGKKRGLSVDEKRAVVLGIYNDSAMPFNLKEIESLASKRGVVQQSVKEINQGLCDDNLVQSDKIGSSNFFWHFNQKAMVEKKAICDNLVELKETLKNGIAKSEKELEALGTDRSAPGRDEKLKELRDIETELMILDKQIALNKHNDPAELVKIGAGITACKAAADRWTDNVFAVKQYFVRKKGISSKEANRYLQIDENFDYSQPPKN